MLPLPWLRRISRRRRAGATVVTLGRMFTGHVVGGYVPVHERRDLAGRHGVLVIIVAISCWPCCWGHCRGIPVGRGHGCVYHK